MTGETDLSQLLRSMQPELQAGEFVFCTCPSASVAELSVRPVCLFHEAEGTTLILPRDQAVRAGLTFTYPCRMITLTIHSSLEAVGFLAAISQALAALGISVNAVSAYYHDHLFVPVDQAEAAMNCLKQLAGC